MIGLALLLLLGLLTALALSTLLTMHRLTHPPRKTYAWAVSRGKPGTPAELTPPRAFEPAVLRVGGRDLPAWRILGDDPDGPLIIHTPGWGDSRLGVLPRLHALTPYASRILSWDPPGLGDAEGVCHLGILEPRLLGEIIDQEAEADATLAQRGVVLFGSSLGAGVSIVAAADSLQDSATGAARFGVRLSDPARQALSSPKSGVIAEAPYREAITPARNVMRLSAMPFAINGPVAFALLPGLLAGRALDILAAWVWGWRGYDRALHARHLRCSLLVLHPELDEVSPLDDGKAIAAAAERRGGRSAELGDAAPAFVQFAVVPGGAHNTLWTDESTKDGTTRAVRSFLARLGTPAVACE